MLFKYEIKIWKAISKLVQYIPLIIEKCKLKWSAVRKKSKATTELCKPFDVTYHFDLNTYGTV